MKTLISPLLVALSIAAVTPALANVRGYELTIVNNRNVPAQLILTQYHSQNFDTERPREFTEALELRTKYIDVPAGETRTIHFNDATGGFWVRWCQLQPRVKSGMCTVLDLVRDKPEIRVR
jgi:hypothetical protein